MDKPVLYIFSGLPGTGKTTLAQLLASELNAGYIRIDTIEQALRDLCDLAVEGEGYRLAYRVVADNLHLGISVVADSCNTIELTRREWEAVAEKENAHFVNIEVTCSDLEEHRRRVLARVSTVPGLDVPSWEQVLSREYHLWDKRRIEVDTAEHTVDESFSQLLSLIGTD